MNAGGLPQWPAKSLVLIGFTLLLQPAQEAQLGPVIGVEGQPGEADTVGYRRVVQLQGDLPLGAIRPRVGDAGPPAAGAVGSPRLGQVQLEVDAE